MIELLKKIANKKTMLVLSVVAFGLGITGSFFYITWFNEMYIADFIDGSYMIIAISSNILSYIGMIIMLIAIVKLESDNSEKIFCASLITGLVISFFTAICLPAIIGSAFTSTLSNLISTTLFSIPSVILIIDTKMNHRIVNVACIVITIMMTLQFVSGIINVFFALIYGFSYINNVFLNLKATLVWFVTLLFFIRFVKLGKPMVTNNGANIEEKLQELKALYEQGTISKDEYDSKKNELLKDF